jgi:tetratricopeptide (TPR) repeat protein
MNARLGLALTLLLPLAAAAPAHAGDDWTGKFVLLKGGKDVKIGHTDAKTGQQVYLAALDLLHYRVLQDRDGWIKVRHLGVEGWFDKKDAVVLNQAVEHFSARIKANANDSAAFMGRGWAWKLQGEFDRALADLNEAVRLNPKDGGAYFNRGLVWIDKRDPDRALADFETAVKLAPKDARFLHARGGAHADKRDVDRALADFDAALALSPANPLILHDRACALCDKKEYAKALKDFDAALKIDPADVNARCNRGLAHSKLKDYARALADFEEAGKLDPRDPQPINLQAWLLATCADAKFRDGKRAVKLATLACELTNWKDAPALDTLAAAQAEAGDFAEAVRWVKAALAIPNLQAEERTEYEQRLKLYEQKKPYPEQ